MDVVKEGLTVIGDVIVGQVAVGALLGVVVVLQDLLTRTHRCNLEWKLELDIICSIRSSLISVLGAYKTEL